MPAIGRGGGPTGPKMSDWERKERRRINAMKSINYIQEDGTRVPVPLFKGAINEIMPQLTQRGYEPLTVAEIIEQRVRAKQQRRDENDNYKLWSHSAFTPSDTFVYHPDGRVKIDSNGLRKISESGDTLESNIEAFNELAEKEFSISPYAPQFSESKYDVWMELMNGDEKLYEQYAEMVNPSRIHEHFDMIIYPSSDYNRRSRGGEDSVVEEYMRLGGCDGHSRIKSEGNSLDSPVIIPVAPRDGEGTLERRLKDVGAILKGKRG